MRTGEVCTTEIIGNRSVREPGKHLLDAIRHCRIAWVWCSEVYTFIETELFTRLVDQYLGEMKYRELQGPLRQIREEVENG